MKNMLGNNESLRELFQGPISDLLVKLNGETGQEVLVELNKFNRHEPCWISNPAQVQSSKPQPLIVISKGQTFWDWLVAREGLHKFFTGETVILRDIFEIPEETLNRTDIMPVFRPVGATNRMALDWKIRLGVNKSYEEADVMKYRNAGGPKVPELSFISRSICPDKDTLGENAKSPDGLMGVPNKIWTNLYGWSDADNLHSLILGMHLDSGDTWTWFPDDRLPGDLGVAFGYWRVDGARAGFSWRYRSSCLPNLGARVASSFSLKS